MTKFLSFISRTYVTLVFCIVFMPMAIILVISFSADSYLSFPPSGWSLKWYGTVLGNTSFMQGFRNSAIIAVIVAALSLALGLPAAYALVRLDFPGRALIRSLVIAPLVLPAMMLGLGILMVFTPAGLVATYPGLVLAHLVMTLPFSIRILQTSLSNLGTDVDEAAMTLGARPLQVFMQITLPRLTPGVIASSAIALILSFDEIVLSLFIDSIYYSETVGASGAADGDGLERTCVGCTERARCDDALAAGTIAAAHRAFCPNAERLAGLQPSRP